jgi:hypothetical protein
VSRNSRVHDEVEADYNIVYKNGQKFLQINTYGSNERKVKGVTGQTIQLDEEEVKELKKTLENKFQEWLMIIILCKL